MIDNLQERVVYPDSPKKQQRLPIPNNDNEERDRQRAISAISYLFDRPQLLCGSILYFGSEFDAPKCVTLIAHFAMFRSNIEPIVNREKGQAGYYVNYLSYITDVLLNIYGQLRKEKVIERYINTTKQTEFIIKVIQEISETAQGQSLAALIDIVEFFPVYTLKHHGEKGYLREYLQVENLHRNVQPLLVAWLTILAEKTNDILNAKRETDPDYSPHDLFKTVADFFRQFTPFRALSTLATSLREVILKSDAVCGLLLSLEIQEVLTSLLPNASGKSLIPTYAKGVHALWGSLDVKPDFARMPILVSYFSSQLVLISNRKTHPEATEKADIVHSVSPKQFGISGISDDLWHGPQQQGIDNRAYYLQKMGDFSTDLDDVQETLSWLDKIHYPYNSRPAKSGVYSGFDTIRQRVSHDLETFQTARAQYPGQMAILATSYYRSVTTYPFAIHEKCNIQPGDDIDFTKSRLLTLLAERGVYYELPDRIVTQMSTNNNSLIVEMPYEQIFNYINWAHDEFSCIQYEHELNRYIGDEGFRGNYCSSLPDVDNFVQTVGSWLYLLKDAYVRNNLQPPGEIENGQLDTTIYALNHFLSTTISDWERFQPYHKDKLLKIATAFFESAFPVGHKCEVPRFQPQQLYAADLERRSQSRNQSSAEDSPDQTIESNPKKCRYIVKF